MSIFAILIDSQNKKYTFITTFSYLTHLRTALARLLTVNSFAHGIIQLILLPIACTVTLHTFLYLHYAYFNQLFHINSTKFKHANI